MPTASRPSTVAAAKKEGSKYFWDKNGTKKLAVTAEDLKKSGLSLRQWANKNAPMKQAAAKSASKPAPIREKTVEHELVPPASAQRKSAPRPAPKKPSMPARPSGGAAPTIAGAGSAAVASLRRADAKKASSKKDGAKKPGFLAKVFGRKTGRKSSRQT